MHFRFESKLRKTFAPIFVAGFFSVSLFPSMVKAQTRPMNSNDVVTCPQGTLLWGNIINLINQKEGKNFLRSNGWQFDGLSIDDPELSRKLWLINAGQLANGEITNQQYSDTFACFNSWQKRQQNSN